MCGGGFLHDLGTLYRFLSHVISRVRVTWFVFLGGGRGGGLGRCFTFLVLCDKSWWFRVRGGGIYLLSPEFITFPLQLCDEKVGGGG